MVVWDIFDIRWVFIIFYDKGWFGGWGEITNKKKVRAICGQ